MIDKRQDCVLFHEFSEADQRNWFDYKQRKFLHNIDTFYYSVKLCENFTKNSDDAAVESFRAYFANVDPHTHEFNVPLDFGQEDQLNYVSLTFAGIYNICMECPEYYDIFMASVVPTVAADSEESVTSEILVQIRSALIWEIGVVKAFEQSFETVRKVISFFGFTIDEVKENRIDYCWHTNYLQNPETYFRVDNLVRMAVTRVGTSKKERGNRVRYEYVMYGGQYYENDYVCLGKRSDKIFLRIYLKSKEVIQQGYKPWFFKVWLFNGLINRYDFYCYEKCFLTGKWQDLDSCRLEFYLKHGSSEAHKFRIRELLKPEHPDYDAIRALADLLTPRVNLVLNVEYQTTRRHSKNYILLPLKDNDKYGVAKRIYSYFDNHALITEYLTHEAFRLIDPEGDSNRSRCDYNVFWKALRATRFVDVAVPRKELRLLREYNQNMSAQFVKKRALNGVVSYGLYRNGLNNNHVMDDVIDFIMYLNDNDICQAKRYKEKRKRQLNSSELSKKPVRLPVSMGNQRYSIVDTLRYTIVDRESGDIVEYVNDIGDDDDAD